MVPLDTSLGRLQLSRFHQKRHPAAEPAVRDRRRRGDAGAELFGIGVFVVGLQAQDRDAGRRQALLYISIHNAVLIIPSFPVHSQFGSYMGSGFY